MLVSEGRGFGYYIRDDSNITIAITIVECNNKDRVVRMKDR
jgi:hypothetical protein